MRRILIKAAYDGTAYNGWQKAKDGVSIEGLLTDALKSLTGEDIKVDGASRTDAGVHSRGNLAVFDTASSIPGPKFAHALNTRLPEDVRVIMSREVADDFHPRSLHTEKTYMYRIQTGEFPDPLRVRYCWNVSFDLDLSAMREAAAFLVGEHDFKSFCSVHTQALTTVREITGIEVDRGGDESFCGEDVRSGGSETVNGGDEASGSGGDEGGLDVGEGVCSGVGDTVNDGDEIRIVVRGYGFLYNMVRIIAGTLVEVGRGRLKPSDLPGIISACDRTKAGPTAPAKGLTLMNIRILED